MFNVTVNTEIARPAEVVFDYIADLTNNADWQFGIESTEWTSALRVDVGSTYDQTMEYKGLVTGYEITAIEPGRSITVETRAGATIPTTVTRTVQVLNESRCRVRVDLSGRLPGWRVITRPLAKRMIRRSIASDFRRLKHRMEEENDPPTGDPSDPG